MTRKATFGAVVFAVLLITSGFSGVVGADATAPAEDAPDASPAPLVSANAMQENETNETQGNQTNETQENETVNATASITFLDQQTNGSVVVVNRTNLSAAGFVAILAQNGTVLGNTSFLEAGVHENLTIELDPGINRSQVLVAVAHLDTNDNQTFDFNATRAQQIGVENATDRPVLNVDNLPVSQVAFVIVGNGTRGRNTTASRVAPDR